MKTTKTIFVIQEGGWQLISIEQA